MSKELQSEANLAADSADFSLIFKTRGQWEEAGNLDAQDHRDLRRAQNKPNLSTSYNNLS